MNPSVKGVLLIILSSASFGAMAPLAKWIYNYDIAPSFLLTLRFGIAAVLLWVYLWLQGGKTSYHITKTQGLTLAGIGGVVYFLLAVFYFNAIQYIPVSLHVIIFYTFPFIVHIISFFVLKEPISKRQLLVLVVAFFGLALTANLGSGGINLLGILFSFLSACCYAAYMLLLGMKKLSNIHSVVVAAYTNLFTAISFLVYSFSRAEIHAVMPFQGWLGVLFLAIVSTVIAIITLSKGIQLIGASKASIVSTFEPIEGVILSILFLGEAMNLLQLAGVVLVLLSIVILNTGDAHKEAPSSDIQEENL